MGKVDSGGTKAFKRDGVGVTAPVLSDGAAAYTPGVAERRGGTSKFFHGDYLNSITRETDSAQATTATKQYDAFGMPLSSTGSSASPFGFAGCFGYQEDDDSGLKLLGHRYYDPSTGRFHTRDPAKDGRNWYGYCENEPTSRADPKGLGWYFRNPMDDYARGWSTWWDNITGRSSIGQGEDFNGEKRIGPHGEPVRIGGWVNAINLLDKNAMTFDGTVHLRTLEDYEDYMLPKNLWWSEHECRHILQEMLFSHPLFFFTVAASYVWPGYDDSPFEVDARNSEGRRPIQNPFECFETAAEDFMDAARDASRMIASG